MTIWKKVFKFIISNSNLIFSTCSILSAITDPPSLRQVGLLEGAQQKFFVLSAKVSLFYDAGHSLHSSVLVVEMNCHLQLIKELSTFDNIFAR